jgi:pyrroloquinoline quinone biosynthesis protein B
LKIIVTGSAAGGGFPQWNCRCRMCLRGWEEVHPLPRRTQASLALSGDGTGWVLLNCSPDIREQIGRTPALQPRRSLRGSPIEAVVLTGGEVDQIGGLLTLREGTPFTLLAPHSVLTMLSRNSIFAVLEDALVSRRCLDFGPGVQLSGGLFVKCFPVAGKPPLYDEARAGMKTGASDHTVGVIVTDGSNRSVAYIPSCARVDERLRAAIAGVDALFFDGTLWSDDELIEAGVSEKTGRRMGHLPVSGAHGTLAALADVTCPRKYFVHINNTNPLNCPDSPECKAIEREGWSVASDGMELSL